MVLTGNVLGFLEQSKGYIMSDTATSAVVDGKMEPVGKQEPTKQLLVTGQWLYENFVQSDETQITRMQSIRALVDKGADAFQINGACEKMIERAKEVDKAAGCPDKVTVDGKEKVYRGPKTQQAMNVRTIIQNSWGALKFARKELESLGYDDRTGYNAMQVLAKRALDAKHIKWHGAQVATPEEKERKAIARSQKAITGVRAQVMSENPQGVGESDGAYLARILELSNQAVQEAREENEAAAVKAIVELLVSKHDGPRLIRIYRALGEWIDEHLPIEAVDDDDQGEQGEPANGVLDEAREVALRDAEANAVTAEQREEAHH
jgi:hypothetical protein